MIKPTVYVTEPHEINPEPLQKLRNYYRLVQGDISLSKNYSPEYENLLIRTYTKVDEQTFEKMPYLKNVMRVGVGLDNINIEVCKRKGVRVFNSAGSNANAVSEYVVAAILSAKRKLNSVTQDDLKSWNRFKFMGTEIKGKTIGLIGFGNIARLVYKKLKGFDCERFIVYDPYIRPETVTDDQITFTGDLNLLLRCSDIVSVHVPLNKQTHHLINAAKIKNLKEGAILINSSRGAVVSEKDIVDWISNNNATYIADVYETEPQINRKLLKCKNFIGTPHIAAMTVEADVGMVQEVVTNFLTNKPVNV